MAFSVNLGRRLVVERVGHPVAKVVNPLGTVITVSADEEEGPIGQQQDLEDDGCEESVTTSALSISSVNTPTVCAEEGRHATGLQDLEENAEVLREHTEICAEMRPANEPAVIDNVSDDVIEELKEHRAICAEAASTATCSSVDLDRVGAFLDVPSSPSLCAERGAVPDCSNVIQPVRQLSHGLARQQRPLKCRVQQQHQETAPVSGSTKRSNAACNFSSDDDLEHINTDELTTVPKSDKDVQRPSGTAVVSSDEDIEHVRHCDVPGNDKRPSGGSTERSRESSARGNARKRSKEKHTTSASGIAAVVTAAPDSAKEAKCFKEVDKTIEVKMEQQEQQRQQQPQQQNYSKKTRARSKRQVQPNSSSSVVEVINMETVIAEPAPEPIIPDLPVPMEEKLEEPLIPSDMIEVIDIVEEKRSDCFTNTPAVPECKIVMPRSEQSKKKSKRQKKSQQQQQSRQILPSHQLESIVQLELPHEDLDKESVEESQQQRSNDSWSTIVRCRSSSVTGTEEATSPSCFEFDSPEDEIEANKENIDTSKRARNNDEEKVVELEEAQIDDPKLEIVSYDKNEIVLADVAEDIDSDKLPVNVEKKSVSEQDTSGVMVERSSSSDEVNGVVGASNVVPMDTEEEANNSSDVRKEQPVSALTEKNIAEVNVAPLHQSTIVPSKKVSRLKKKKRR